MPDRSRDPQLPAPEADGAADHLPGVRLPAVELPATDGSDRRLDRLGPRAVVFVHPGIGGPGDDDLMDEWTAVPGARGCTPEACAFRDGLAGFEAAGAQVLGLSSQSSAEQARAARELALTYPLLSDEALGLRDALGLPTFEFHGGFFYKRLTLIAAHGTVEAALYPVFPPDAAARQALGWLEAHPAA